MVVDNPGSGADVLELGAMASKIVAEAEGGEIV
jgi:hypothetical protein